MQITEQALKEFKELWLLDHPDQTLEKDQLLEMANRTLTIIQAVYKSISQNE